MGVMGGRGGEVVEVGGEHVGARAMGAPRGEAGGDAGVVLEVRDSRSEGLRIGPVGQDARVGWPELVLDSLAAAWHARKIGGLQEETVFLLEGMMAKATCPVCLGGPGPCACTRGGWRGP